MGLEEKLPSGVLLTTVAKMLNIARKNSLWPAQFGLACCAIEMMAVGGPRFDIARFGMERFSATPRQADLMIVAGRVSQKMAPVLRQIYDQMPEPKWVLAMGVCASSGGMFNNYAIVQGGDHVVPLGRREFRDSVLRQPEVVWPDPATARRLTTTEQIVWAHRVDKDAAVRPGATLRVYADLLPASDGTAVRPQSPAGTADGRRAGRWT